jgi:hypothetical protein
VREADEPQEWCVLETYPSATAAEADAGYLRSERVAARVQLMSDLPGQSGGAQLMVDANLAHRARWLLKLGTVSEAELEYLATGNLQNPQKPPEDAQPARNWPAVMVVLIVVIALLVALLQYFGRFSIPGAP